MESERNILQKRIRSEKKIISLINNPKIIFLHRVFERGTDGSEIESVKSKTILK